EISVADSLVAPQRRGIAPKCEAAGLQDISPVGHLKRHMCVLFDQQHCRSPSRPGEFHPEPLTDPDVRLSPHPARATQRRLAPSGETVGFLRSPVDPTNTVSDPPPSLHGHYPASSLLWGGPRLTGPSVLSASRVPRLCLFPWHGQPGSQVPYESPDESHAS